MSEYTQGIELGVWQQVSDSFQISAVLSEGLQVDANNQVKGTRCVLPNLESQGGSVVSQKTLKRCFNCRDFNLKGCSEVTDTLLVMLSKHRPEAPEDFDDVPTPTTAQDEPASSSYPQQPNSPQDATANPGGSGDGGDAALRETNAAVVGSNHEGASGAHGSQVEACGSDQAGRRDLMAGPTRLQVAGGQPGDAATGLSDWRERRAQAGVRRLVLEGCSNITSTGVRVRCTSC